jgi:hypothetical protein
VNNEIYHCRRAALEFYYKKEGISGADEDWCKQEADGSEVDEDVRDLAELIRSERGLARNASDGRNAKSHFAEQYVDALVRWKEKEREP